ncbi:hypothetical protein [Luteolibacter soli]|uniref:Lipoprotein n=1 Tax=Luteolibacter soli TaxID=3135280 RepID=A0ABU9AV13_9BACT
MIPMMKMKKVLLTTAAMMLMACSKKQEAAGTDAAAAPASPAAPTAAATGHEIRVYKMGAYSRETFFHKFSRRMIIGFEGEVPREEQDRLDARTEEVDVPHKSAIYLGRRTDDFGIGSYHSASAQVDPEASGESEFVLINNSRVPVSVRVYWKEDPSAEAAGDGGAKP